MSDKSKVEKSEEEIINQAVGFWQKNSKSIIIVSAVVIIAIGGYLGYKNFIQLPNEQKASEELFTADRKSTRLNSSHEWISRMPSSA